VVGVIFRLPKVGILTNEELFTAVREQIDASTKKTVLGSWHNLMKGKRRRLRILVDLIDRDRRVQTTWIAGSDANVGICKAAIIAVVHDSK